MSLELLSQKAVARGIGRRRTGASLQVSSITQCRGWKNDASFCCKPDFPDGSPHAGGVRGALREPRPAERETCAGRAAPHAGQSLPGPRPAPGATRAARDPRSECSADQARLLEARTPLAARRVRGAPRPPRAPSAAPSPADTELRGGCGLRAGGARGARAAAPAPRGQTSCARRAHSAERVRRGMRAARSARLAGRGPREACACKLPHRPSGPSKWRVRISLPRRLGRSPNDPPESLCQEHSTAGWDYHLPGAS